VFAFKLPNAASKSTRAKVFKLADKTSNLRALAVSAAADWSVKRRIEYINWARTVVKGLRGANKGKRSPGGSLFKRKMSSWDGGRPPMPTSLPPNERERRRYKLRRLPSGAGSLDGQPVNR